MTAWIAWVDVKPDYREKVERWYLTADYGDSIGWNPGRADAAKRYEVREDAEHAAMAHTLWALDHPHTPGVTEVA